MTLKIETLNNFTPSCFILNSIHIGMYMHLPTYIQVQTSVNFHKKNTPWQSPPGSRNSTFPGFWKSSSSPCQVPPMQKYLSCLLTLQISVLPVFDHHIDRIIQCVFDFFCWTLRRFHPSCYMQQFMFIAIQHVIK